MAQVTIVRKSDLGMSNRIDSQFYQSHLIIDTSKGKWIKIKDVLINCEYGLSLGMNDEEVGVPMYKMDDIENTFLIDDNIRFAEVSEKQLKTYLCEDNDVYFNRVNSEEFVGRTGIYKNNGKKAVFASYLIRLQPDSKRILPQYLNIFLNSKFGKKQINRYKRRAVNQANVNAQELKEFYILEMDLSKQLQVAEMVDMAWNNRTLAKQLFERAENLLLKTLGLDTLTSDWPNSYEVTLDSVIKAKRFDSEHFHIKYLKMLETMKSHTKMKELHEITTLIGKPSNPTYAVEEDENKTFIVTQKHLGKYFPLDNFWEDPEALYTTKDFLNKNQEYVLQPNDLILYSVGAYIGKANVYDAEIPAIIGSFLTIIRTTEECNPYYLACYLNSPIGTQLTKRYQKGLAQQYIYPVDIKNFPIPLIEKTKQNEIADLIIEARELMKASKALVKKAIMTVEKELS